MTVKVAMNGFGRIGRAVLRIAQEDLMDGVEIVAINAGADSETLAHLFRYDSCYGRFNGTVETDGEDKIIVNGKEVKIFRENDPANFTMERLRSRYSY